MADAPAAASNPKSERGPEYVCIDRVSKKFGDFIAVNNVFGERYSSLGYVGYPPPEYAREQVYYPSPERNFKVGASFKF